MIDPESWVPVELPYRTPIEPMKAPVDLVMIKDVRWREGLWTVVYRDDGTIGVYECPIPAERPDGGQQ